MKRFLTYLVVAVVTAALVWAALERRRRYTAELTADSVVAAADHTHSLALHALAGAAVGWQRRAVQAQIHADAVDQELKVADAARVSLRAAIAQLRAHVQTVVHVDSGDQVRSADFQLRQEPYTVTATAILPLPPASATLDVLVLLDTAHVRARITCGDPDHDVRPTNVLVTGPKWLGLSLDSVQTEPRVCSPPPPALSLPGFRVPWWMAPLAFLAGFVLAR